MNYTKCENTFTATEAKFLRNAATQTGPSDSRLSPNVDSDTPTIGATIASFVFVAA
jgi:hypothetical protein